MPATLMPIESGKPIVLDKPIVLVGRHPDCDAVILNRGKISRRHCAVALVNNNVVVRDLCSMNGVWVNGNRIDQQAVPFMPTLDLQPGKPAQPPLRPPAKQQRNRQKNNMVAELAEHRCTKFANLFGTRL